jgi:hypothetical protein
MEVGDFGNPKSGNGSQLLNQSRHLAWDDERRYAYQPDILTRLNTVYWQLLVRVVENRALLEGGTIYER